MTTETPPSQTPDYSPGLEGVIAGTTKICTVSPDGERLTYRGYDVEQLCEHYLYEDVAYLLIEGELPDNSASEAYREWKANSRTVPEIVKKVLLDTPQDTHPMDALKAGVAILGMHDPDKNNQTPEARKRKAGRLIAQMPTLVAYATRAQKGQPIVEPDPSLSHAENLLYMLTGEKPTPSMSKIMNAILIIYAEHGFNASTFTARVAVSTLSDIYSGVLSAIGALKGPLHGGANEQAMLTFLEIKSPDNVEAWVEKALAEKRKIMGFGHRAYKNGDPRARLLKKMREALIKDLDPAPWPEIADKLETLLYEKKGLLPNVDYPIAYLFYMMGLPTPIYTPLFAIGRVAGWTAHVIEQLDNNRLIRPKALYQGQALRPVPVPAHT